MYNYPLNGGRVNPFDLINTVNIFSRSNCKRFRKLKRRKTEIPSSLTINLR